MKFDNAGAVEEVVWMMRLAELPRASNRTILNELYNGDPPFDPAEAEENNVEINRNDLSGPNILSRARQTWNTAFLNQENFFTVSLDSGPPTKRAEWGRTITKHINRELKQARLQIEEKRSTGGNVMLHGIGPCTWDTRRSVIPTPLLIPSLLIPSETNIDFENLSYFAIFREWTVPELVKMVKGARRDKGWNIPLVESQIKYLYTQVQKQPNATAYQYMPERIEELDKQDMGWWGSDAVPTVDVWDFYFKGPKENDGWYRRMILDWGVSAEAGVDIKSLSMKHGNSEADGAFLYNSKDRQFAKHHSEIIHCQFGDCSAVFPQKYHSVRSLGWLEWGTCDLQNRLHSKFNESVFEQMMWFFRTASDQEMKRLKKANFTHMGVIPAGIDWVKASERFTPDWNLVQGAFQRNRQLMDDSSSGYNNVFDSGSGKEMREIEVLARLNARTALTSGMISLAYTYEEFKYKEQCRRICIKVKPDPIAQRIRLAILKDGVDPNFIDVERWIVKADRVIGAGDKTLASTQVQMLQGIRKNLNPDAQRTVDHMSIAVWTDDHGLAEELAPVKSAKVATKSMHDAQLSTERLMRGLPLVPTPDMVYEDYVMVWLADLELMTNRATQNGNMASPEQILGWNTMVMELQGFIAKIAENEEEKPKVQEFEQRLGKCMNLIKGFQQRLVQQAKAAAKAQQNGEGNGIKPQDVVKAQFEAEKDKRKLQQMQVSHANKTAQRQVTFDLDQQREDARVNAEIARENAKAAHELIRNSLQSPEPFSE